MNTNAWFIISFGGVFLAYVEAKLRTHSIVSFYVLLFCHYWACGLLSRQIVGNV
jgi:hypothetical protein